MFIAASSRLPLNTGTAIAAKSASRDHSPSLYA
jgi:hypothetical protein